MNGLTNHFTRTLLLSIRLDLCGVRNTRKSYLNEIRRLVRHLENFLNKLQQLYIDCELSGICLCGTFFDAASGFQHAFTFDIRIMCKVFLFLGGPTVTKIAHFSLSCSLFYRFHSHWRRFFPERNGLAKNVRGNDSLVVPSSMWTPSRKPMSGLTSTILLASMFAPLTVIRCFSGAVCVCLWTDVTHWINEAATKWKSTSEM